MDPGSRIGALIGTVVVVSLLTSGLAAAAPGDLDPHFGTGGIRTIDAGDYDHMTDMALDGSKVITVGRVFHFDDSSQDFALARFTAAGRPDPSFGGDGMVITDLGTDDELPGAIAVHPDGGYLVAGTEPLGDVWTTDVVLVRYTESGAVDTTFGTNGVHRFDVSSIDGVAAMAIQPDGKILVAGNSGGPSYTFTVVRLNPDGSFDTDADGDALIHFSTDGKAFPDAGGYNQRVHSMALQADGKIVIVGTSGVNENGDMAMARLDTDGSVDTGFGTDGFVHIDASSTEWFNDVAIQADGAIVVVGGSYIGEAGLDGIIARYTSSGDPDTNFGTAGLLQAPTGVASYSDQVSGVVIQPNGRIVVAGDVTIGPDEWNYFMRLLPSNGAPDPSFGEWMPGFSRFATPLPHTFGGLVMSGNRVVMGGQTSDAASDYYTLAVVIKMAASKTTLRTRKRPSRIVARGRVSPKHSNQKVTVILQKKSGGSFVKVASKRVTLNGVSRYRTKFKRPAFATRCRVITKFPGDAAHRPSGAKRSFAC